MKVYIKFLIYLFTKSLFFVFFVMLSLVFILNLLTELDFFKKLEVEIYFPLFLSLLNSPDLLFEIFPFIFLITTQLFFIRLFEDKEIEIFKYSGLKNSKIIKILSITSFLAGIMIVSLFYNFSSSLKNFYLELKSNYTNDGKYLAVITKNGLWIKDKINNKTLIINSLQVNQNFLINNFITEFDEEFNVVRNIQSEKIDTSNKLWIIYNAKIYNENNYSKQSLLELNTNFDHKRIQTLYSNLSSLNIFQILELKKNYQRLNYSVTEIDLQLLKLILYPFYLLLITVFSALIMLNIKEINSTTFKISIGLFFSVIIYYLNNFSHVLGSTERISLITATIAPLIILTIINGLMIYKINDK